MSKHGLAGLSTAYYTPKYLTVAAGTLRPTHLNESRAQMLDRELCFERREPVSVTTWTLSQH